MANFLQFPCLFLLSHTLSIAFHLHTSVLGQCHDDQSSSLLQLKQGFSSSLKLPSWQSGTDCCYWEGVTCGAAGHVIGLDLSSRSISGLIDSSLFNLRKLRRLNLAYNDFYPSLIPSGFDHLANLTHLNLSYSGFKGQIPLEISRLTRLVSLDLSASNFETILELQKPNLKSLVQNLSGLTELFLDGTDISADSKGWCQVLSSSLPNLRVLSLSNCDLSGPIDSSILKLSFLSELRLKQNNLSSAVPDFFANFSSLTSLHLSSCGLHGEFPENIFRLPNLRTLDISGNLLLTGYLPDFRKDSALQVLSLQSTNLSGKLPNSIGNLKFLNTLMLGNCNFYGSIPFSISNLTRLVYLELSFNNFSGEIPQLASSKKIAYIELSNNRFSGQIPYKKFSNLINLDLRNNLLEGKIPPSLFTLPLLRELELSYNLLSGHVDEFRNGSSSLLERVSLNSNKLTGTIPRSLFQLRRLRILELSSNNFSGTLDLDMFESLRNLTILDLSDITFSFNETFSDPFFPWMDTLNLVSCNISKIPNFLRNLEKLKSLDLSNNRIHGQVPKWIWNIGNGLLVSMNLSHNFLDSLERPLPDFSLMLSIVDLHSNMLQGPIPMPPPSSYFLDYSNNQFTSIIPSNIGSYISYAIFFSLSRNNVSGELPASLCDVTILEVLDLSYNHMSGPIPPCLGEIGSTLKVLSLRRNKFHGTLPQNFTNGCSLRSFDSNGNRFEGQIPRSFTNCTMLEVLDLGNNWINDTYPSWLETLSDLRVLILRSNQFHGPIESSETDHAFPKLQIIDLSSNSLTGNLPLKWFRSWKAMMLENGEAQSNLPGQTIGYKVEEIYGLYYQDSVMVTSKGLDLELVKILTIFISVDLSNNGFQGEIPEAIGELKSVRVLNMSRNNLTGRIPLSLEKLVLLESLDLSRNKLSGEIPWQLTELTFLAVLNLSFNLLMGTIPQSRQFLTFTNDSFQGNLALCGLPLSRTCGNVEALPLPPTFLSPESTSEFDWTFIWSGFGCGYGLGAGIGFVIEFFVLGRKWRWYVWRIEAIGRNRRKA